MSARVMEDIHIFRAAKLLIKEQGDDVSAYVDMEFNNTIERRDIKGAAVWLRIAKAINEMLRETPRPGEQRH